MSTSAKLLISQLRAVTGDAEITPERLATVLDSIYNECNDDGGLTELPEYLAESRITSIGTTAQTALSKANDAATKAQQALNNIAAQGGCTCEELTYAEYSSLCSSLEIPAIKESLFPNA